MKFQVNLLRSVMLLGAVASASIALATPSRNDGFAACVHAVAADTGVRHLDVVRRVDHFGDGNAEYWVNAAASRDAEPALKSYCRTRRDQVTLIESTSGRWTPTTSGRPNTRE